MNLPPGVDANTIEASARNGIVTLRIPQPAPASAHRVPLRSSGSDKPIDGGSSVADGDQVSSARGQDPGDQNGDDRMDQDPALPTEAVADTTS